MLNHFDSENICVRRFGQSIAGPAATRLGSPDSRIQTTESRALIALQIDVRTVCPLNGIEWRRQEAYAMARGKTPSLAMPLPLSLPFSLLETNLAEIATEEVLKVKSLSNLVVRLP